MLCEKCKKKAATVFYQENINGKTKSYSLCEDCAEKLREKGDLQDFGNIMNGFVNPFSKLHEDFFNGFFGIPARISTSETKKCPNCGTTFREIAEGGKVGCPTCYETFRDELSDLIRSVHGTTTHTGQVPARHRAKQERNEKLKNLRNELKASIEKEEYEKAATLRDEIRKLESESNKEEK